MENHSLKTIHITSSLQPFGMTSARLAGQEVMFRKTLSLSIYIYLYIYIFIYLFICIYIYLYVYIYIHTVYLYQWDTLGYFCWHPVQQGSSTWLQLLSRADGFHVIFVGDTTGYLSLATLGGCYTFHFFFHLHLSPGLAFHCCAGNGCQITHRLPLQLLHARRPLAALAGTLAPLAKPGPQG